MAPRDCATVAAGSLVLEARLLGRPVVRVDDCEVALSGRALALVAYLALEGPTPRGKLADLFWGGAGEEAARRNLRRELYRLRETPLRERLAGEGDVLALQGPLETDVARFQTLLASDPEAALALYRGSLLEGFEPRGASGFEEWLARRREGLAAERRRALTRRAEEREAEGRLAGALADRLALLEEDELQEVHHRAAMRLHALLGEREAALERFSRLTRLLADELGLAPLPETAALARRIRAAEPPGPSPASGPVPGSALRPPLVGREAALARLEGPGPPLRLLLGEPGVGKTRLAQEFALEQPGRLTLRGHPELAGAPLYPVAEVLREVIEAAGLEWARGLEPVWRREAARLVPELEPRRTSVPPGPPAPEGRARFLEGLARTLLAALGPGGVALLDDVHAFDASSLELVAHLGRLLGRPGAPAARLVATARPAELGGGPAGAVLAALERDGKLERLELGPLGETDVLRLVRLLSGGGGAVLFSRRLFLATAGNPLFVLETLRSLFAAGLLWAEPGGGWTTPFDTATEDYAELPIPPTVREAVLGRVDRLGAAARRLLEAASLAEEPFEADLVAGASALAEWEGLTALEGGLSAGLLEGGGGYRFGHDLVRRALAAGLGPERRRLLHRRLAAGLAAQGRPAAVAGHLERALRPLEAAPWRVRAAEAAQRVYAYAEALSHHARALEDGLPDRDAFAVRLARVGLHRALDDASGRAAELAALEALAERLPEPAGAEVALARALYANESGHYEAALAETERLLADPALPGELAALALLQSGGALLRLGRLPEAEARFGLVLEREAGGPSERAAEARAALCRCAMGRGDYVAAALHNEAALAAYRALGERAGEAGCRIAAGVLESLAGRREPALAELLGGLALSRELGLVAVQRTALLNLSKLHLDEDDFAGARPHLTAGLALAREPQDPYLEGIFLSQLGQAERGLGNLEGSLSSLQRAIALADRAGAAPQAAQRRLVLAELLRDLGDPTGAHALLEAARPAIEATGPGQLARWLELGLASLETAAAPSAALTRLAGLGPLEALLSDDAARNAWLTGLACLAQGEPAGARAAVEGLAASPALLGRAAELRLAAGVAAGRVEPADLADAEALLATGRVPPLEALDLRAALARALESAGEPARAGDVRAGARNLLLELAASLDPAPDLRAAFLERHRDLAGS